MNKGAANSSRRLYYKVVMRKLLRSRLFDTCEFRVNHDAAAIFADDDFLVHLDFHLLLRRDAVEAAAAGVALDVDDTQTVACVLAYALERSESAGVNLRFESLRLLDRKSTRLNSSHWS